MIYCKTLDVRDYSIQETTHAKNIAYMLENKVQHRFEHPHRAWEYGIVLNALRKNGARTVLDVGGGGSIFGPMCAWLDMDITQVDPGDCSHWVEQQKAAIGRDMTYKQLNFMEYVEDELFDAVTCISVMEHIPNDLEFFGKLLGHVKPGGILAITVDFHPSGTQLVSGHLRTYNAEAMAEFIELAIREGFAAFGDELDYSWRGADVNNYTFASLVLRKVK